MKLLFIFSLLFLLGTAPRGKETFIAKYETFDSLDFEVHSVHEMPGVSFKVIAGQGSECLVRMINNETKKIMEMQSPYTCFFLRGQVFGKAKVFQDWRNNKINRIYNDYLVFSGQMGNKKVVVELPLSAGLSANEKVYSPLIVWMNYLRGSFLDPNRREFLLQTQDADNF